MGVTSSFARGVFTFSLDFELVWGSRDLYADPGPLLQMARVTRERVFLPLLQSLTQYGICATWATVGHLFLDRAARVNGRLHPEIQPPQHAWQKAPWFEGVPEGTEAEHPEFYGRSLVLQLQKAGQEIGSHSFSHPIFGDPGCSRETAESELARCVVLAKELGISMKSFVFPRNVAGHIDLLAKHGFRCWRGLEPVWYRSKKVPGPVSRLAHLADVAIAGRPPTVMPFRDAYGMWCIPASASFLPVDGIRRVIPLSQRARRGIRGLDQAVLDRRICHLWLHPINLANDPERMLAALGQIFAHAARLRDAGKLDILSMGQISDVLDAQSGARA